MLSFHATIADLMCPGIAKKVKAITMMDPQVQVDPETPSACYSTSDSSADQRSQNCRYDIDLIQLLSDTGRF
jgi:hypothetical protein